MSLPSGGYSGPQPRLIQHRGKTIPLFVLDSLLRHKTEFASLSNELLANKLPGKALIVNRSHGAIAFGIDRMLGKQEAVVRPLDDSLVRVTGMAGATDLGDGRPTLVLDLASLGHSVMQGMKAAL